MQESRRGCPRLRNLLPVGTVCILLWIGTRQGRGGLSEMPGSTQPVVCGHNVHDRTARHAIRVHSELADKRLLASVFRYEQPIGARIRLATCVPGLFGGRH